MPAHQPAATRPPRGRPGEIVEADLAGIGEWCLAATPASPAATPIATLKAAGTRGAAVANPAGTVVVQAGAAKEKASAKPSTRARRQDRGNAGRPVGVPPAYMDRYTALSALSSAEVKAMLQKADLPVQGNHRTLVVRLVQHLADQPAVAATVPPIPPGEHLEKETKHVQPLAEPRGKDELQRNDADPTRDVEVEKLEAVDAGDQLPDPIAEPSAAEASAALGDAVAGVEGAPGICVLPLSPDEARTLLQDDSKWLRHFESVTQATLELSLSSCAGNSTSEEEGPPPRLCVASPNGQEACEGIYCAAETALANGQPLWKKEDSQHWLYFGANGMWFVGGVREKNKDFVCSSGYLRFGHAHKGAWPDALEGVWQRSDGSKWVEDPAILVSASARMGRPRPGLHICLADLAGSPLHRFNGQLGRILGQSGAAGLWRVRLADGCEDDFSAANMVQRDVSHSEAWLRGGSAQAKAQWQCLVSALQGRREPIDGNTTQVKGATVLSLPSKAAEYLDDRKLKELMHEKQVIVVWGQREWSGDASSGNDKVADTMPPSCVRVGQILQALVGAAEESYAVEVREVLADNMVEIKVCSSDKVELACLDKLRVLRTAEVHLIIHGSPMARCAAALHVMAIVEKAIPGSFPDVVIRQLIVACGDQTPSQCGCTILQGTTAKEAKDQGDELVLKHHARVVAASGAVLESVGSRVCILGNSEQRQVATELLHLVRKASEQGEIPGVPAELESSCTRLLVPEGAAEAAAIIAQKHEQAANVCCLWIQPPSGSEVAATVKDAVVAAGNAVLALYEGAWCSATVVEMAADSSTAVIQWDYDGSRATVQAAEVKRSEEPKAKRQRQQLLQTAWTLAIFGAVRARKAMALRVMASAEKHCPGLWTKDINDAVSALRALGEDASVGVEARRTRGRDVEPLLHAAATKPGLVAVRRAAAAAGCCMQVVGDVVFLLGSAEERACGLEYLRWILAETPEDTAAENTAAGPTAGGRRRQAVEYTNAEGDRVAFKRSKGPRGETLDFYVNDERRVHSLTRLTAEGRSLHLSGTACKDWSPSLRIVVPTGQEAAAEQVVELFKGCQMVGVDRANRDDVCVLDSTWGQVAPLQPKFKDVELKTRTLVLRAHDASGCGGDEQERKAREPSAHEELHICGRCSEARAKAVQEIRALLAPAEAGGPPNKKHKPAEQATPLLPDPKKEIEKLVRWPKDYGEWQEVQSIVWAGHPKLAPGWFRMWSRSKQREYYVRSADYQATFDISQATAGA